MFVNMAKLATWPEPQLCCDAGQLGCVGIRDTFHIKQLGIEVTQELSCDVWVLQAMRRQT